MPIIEDLKEYAERATGLRRPGKGKAPDFARERKPHAVRFKDVKQPARPGVRVYPPRCAKCLGKGRAAKLDASSPSSAMPLG
jgi:hypothetical protein